MKTLHITVSNKVATYRKHDGDIVCGNTDYEFRFTFDSEWADHATKTARLRWGGQYYDVSFTGNTCRPWEDPDAPLITDVDSVEIGVYAGKLSTTTAAVIKCKRSILCGSTTLNPGAEKVYFNEAKEAADRAEAAAKSVEGLEAQIEKNTKNIYNLWAGLVPEDPFVTDDSTAYEKIVPARALPFAEINKIGGMTYRGGGALKDSKVTKMLSRGKNLFNMANLHESAAIDGTSFTPNVWAYNQDFFTDTVGASTAVPMAYIGKLIPLSPGAYTFSWESDAPDSRVTICTINPVDGSVVKQFFDKVSGVVLQLTEAALVTIRRGTNVAVTYTNFQINRGTTVQPYEPYMESALVVPAEAQALDGYGQGNPDNPEEHNYLDLDKKRFVACGHIVGGEWEAYAEAQTTDLSETLPDDNFVEVVGDGTITAINEHGQAVPTTVTYMVEEVMV